MTCPEITANIYPDRTKYSVIIMTTTEKVLFSIWPVGLIVLSFAWFAGLVPNPLIGLMVGSGIVLNCGEIVKIWRK